MCSVSNGYRYKWGFTIYIYYVRFDATWKKIVYEKNRLADNYQAVSDTITIIR